MSKKSKVINLRKNSPRKQVSHERRKRKATNPSTRKAVTKAPAPVPAGQLPLPSYKAVYVPIDDINVDLEKRRPVIPKMVETLVTSIRVEGLRSALWVIKVEDETVLVSGLQRLEALKVLKWKEVPCVYVEPDEIVARRLQLIDNAHRAELSKMEKANQTKEWLELTESLDRISGEKLQKKPGRPEGGDAKAARDLPVQGKTVDAKRKKIASDRKIAALDPAVQAAAIKAGLDNNTGKLEEIARQKTREAQLAKINELASPRKPGGGDPPDKAAGKNESTFEVLKGAWKKAKRLRRAWGRASPSDRTRFVTKVLKYTLKDD
jgi:ParB-like chromosome segregation protein Spo0J